MPGQQRLCAARQAFDVFALVVLPTLYVLGVFTFFARLVASSTEDLLYGRAINRIRQYYLHVAGGFVTQRSCGVGTLLAVGWRTHIGKRN